MGTSENPCAAPMQCIQFYPPKRSLQISGNVNNGYAAITLIPENPDLPSIAIVMVEGDVWVEDPPNVQFLKTIDLNHDRVDKRILAFDKDIKNIKLHGEIKAFSDRETEDVMQMLWPYEQTNDQQRMLMRVTGRMENRPQILLLTGGPRGDEKYVFQPKETAGMPMNFAQFFKWPQRSYAGAK
uniref:Uncharacterized protein n=1 Tax=Schistocephalus solidus TaxID=70667 RepID=A0A0X3NJN9_SCHSO